MTDDVAKIAEGLTDKEGLALRGIYPWSSPIEEDQGEATLYRFGLWNPRPKYHEKVITPLGLKVRQHLERNQP